MTSERHISHSSTHHVTPRLRWQQTEQLRDEKAAAGRANLGPKSGRLMKRPRSGPPGRGLAGARSALRACAFLALRTMELMSRFSSMGNSLHSASPQRGSISCVTSTPAQTRQIMNNTEESCSVTTASSQQYFITLVCSCFSARECFTTKKKQVLLQDDTAHMQN